MRRFKRNQSERWDGSMRMNLQLFAEGGDGAGSGDGDGSGAGGGSGDGIGSGTKKTFDDILEDKDYQAEFDRRVQQGITTAVANAREKWEALMDDKLSEAEKLAKMTKDEKAQYMQKKHEKELSDREAAVTRRELMAEAKNTLTEKQLPLELADVLDYADAEACKKSIGVIETAFKKAVEAGVQERLKGGKPPRKADSSAVTKEEYRKMGYSERLKLKNENPELYKQLSGM